MLPIWTLGYPLSEAICVFFFFLWGRDVPGSTCPADKSEQIGGKVT